jgi:hypothetical protein
MSKENTWANLSSKSLLNWIKLPKKLSKLAVYDLKNHEFSCILWLGVVKNLIKK